MRKVEHDLHDAFVLQAARVEAKFGIRASLVTSTATATLCHIIQKILKDMKVRKETLQAIFIWRETVLFIFLKIPEKIVDRRWHFLTRL